MVKQWVVALGSSVVLAITGTGWALPGPAVATSSSSSSAETAGWFHDPVSAAGRRAELTVPADPAGSAGPIRQTKATFRTHNGSLAVPISWAGGHTVVAGEALALTDKSLFAFDSPVPSAVAAAQLRALVPAFGQIRAVTCEGNADFGGVASHEQALSVARARAICALVHSAHPAIATKSIGYGDGDPVVVGGKASERSQNRRVDIVITRSTPTAPELSTAVAGDSAATITFSPPTSNGGMAITGYRVSLNGGKTWAALTTTGHGPFKAILHGLTDGTTYPVAVRAVNADGHGPASNRLHVTPQSGVTHLALRISPPPRRVTPRRT